MDNHPLESKIKLLLIEDSLGDARLFYEYVKEGAHDTIEFVHKVRLSSGLQVLAIEQFDLVILDLDLPDSSGMDTLVQLRKLNTEIPVIICSGYFEIGTAMEAIKNGAQDFIVKGNYESEALFRTINFAIERRRYQEKINKKENSFDITFEQAPMGLAHISYEGKWLKVNSKVSGITGYSKQELYCSDLKSITSKSIDFLKHLLNGEIEKLSQVQKWVHRDGSTIDIKLTISKAKNEKGELLYLIAVIDLAAVS